MYYVCLQITWRVFLKQKPHTQLSHDFLSGQHPHPHPLEGDNFPEVLCSQCARALLDGGQSRVTGFWAWVGCLLGNESIISMQKGDGHQPNSKDLYTQYIRIPLN